MLVAHPSPVVQRMFAVVLEREGLSVLAASDADEAMQAVAEHDPAVVLLDPALPAFDSELRRSLAAAGAAVLFLAGPDLAPPYQPGKVVAAVRAALATSPRRDDW